MKRGSNSVQSQNDRTLEQMINCAMAVRQNPSGFSWLFDILDAQGQAHDAGALVSLAHIPEQAGEWFSGTWVSTSGEFFEFAAIISRESNQLLELEDWTNVTSSTVVSAHSRGTGKSFGHLAKEVLDVVLQLG